MRNIELKKLTLSNFKSQTRTIDFGKTTKISGCNGAGKTTTIKAWLWLLTGKTDPLHGANHELFDNRIPLTEHTPEAVVTATLSIDGQEIQIERADKAKFERKRGSAVWTKASSDEYRYAIDGVKVSASVWDRWIEDNICPTNILTYCLYGEFFTTLAEDDKAAARKVIEALVGKPDEANMTGDYSSITEDLKRFSVEDLKQRYRNMLKPLNEEARTIPALLQEKMNKRSEMQNIASSTADDSAAIKKRIEEIDEMLLSRPIDSPERLEALKKVDALKKEMEEAKEAHYENAAKAKREEEMCRRDLDAMRSDVANLDVMDKAAKSKIAILEGDMEEAANKLATAKRRTFNEDEAVCEYCGQKLPQQMLEERRSKYLEAKKKEIDTYKKLGEGFAEQIREIEASVEANENKRKELNAEIENKAKELEMYAAVAATYGTDFEDGSRYKELKEKIDAVVIPPIEQQDLTPHIEEKRMLMERLEKVLSSSGAAEEAKKNIIALNSEIADLIKKQRENGNEIARVETLILTLQQYESEKAELLASMVNNHLNGCTISMFEIQKNGDRKETCTVCGADGVKYATLNNSARLLVNIQIQKLFCELNNISLPIMCDECSVYDSNHIPKGDGQYVYIYCSDDTALKFETEN
jgi:DNA repair exonuclease SbcCD ATPase subunit